MICTLHYLKECDGCGYCKNNNSLPCKRQSKKRREAFKRIIAERERKWKRDI